MEDSKKLLMDWYLVNFLLRDYEKLVSWQTVNSITEMQLFFTSTKSGLNEWKTVATGGFSGRSANIEWERRIDEMWFTKIVGISLCLFVYLERRPGDEQFESTCLLVWIWLQSEHALEVALPHLTIFAAVANCCWIAFLTNLKEKSGREVVRRVHLAISLEFNSELMDEKAPPWIIRLLICSRAFSV